MIFKSSANRGLRLALTQRIVNASGYQEPRDALAHDWSKFMNLAMPDCSWLALPNCPLTAEKIVLDWGIEGLILTGGETPGTSPLRDQVERKMVELFLERDLPILGVCRGAQLLFTMDNLPLDSCDLERHVATRHALELVEAAEHSEYAKISPQEVNSYHEFGVLERHLGNEWQVVLRAADKVVEMAYHKHQELMGIMWHPERELKPMASDVSIFRKFFGLDK